ncbi:MAG TPA: hypothetical protein VFO46_19530 [Candidatus Sulfotelmatobacter sp.]|nr:hypothetical protein [Candidatus Sulfotelmatobacter sp.]
MMIANLIAAGAALTLTIAGVVAGQTSAATPETAPPKLLVLVYQRFSFAKRTDVDRWEIATARACQSLEVPNSWVGMESITGEPEVLSFDPFDSFAQLDKPVAEWGRIYATHPELGRLQAQITAALTSQRTLIAVRRDDLSYRGDRIDLSKARFMRVLEVRLHPGRENEFAEAFQKLTAAYEKIGSDLPWVVYQVNLGMPSPTFLAFVPLKAVGQNDDLLNIRERLHVAEGEAAERMQQIARDAYASTESNLYSINPEKSHVSKGFAAGDLDFWTPRPQAAAKPDKKKSMGKKIKPGK